MITSKIENEEKIELVLKSGITGKVFYSISENISKELNAQSIRAMLALLTQKLFALVAYDALVTKTHGSTIEINAGSKQGLKPSSIVTIFEITSFDKKNDFYEYQKNIIAKARVEKLNENLAICRVIDQNKQFKIERFSKVSFQDFFSKEIPLKKK